MNVELYAEAQKDEKSITQAMDRGERLAGTTGGLTYTASVPTGRSVADYTPRIVPQHAGAFVPLEAALFCGTKHRPGDEVPACLAVGSAKAGDGSQFALTAYRAAGKADLDGRAQLELFPGDSRAYLNVGLGAMNARAWRASSFRRLAKRGSKAQLFGKWVRRSLAAILTR